MIDLVKKEILRHGDVAKVVSINRLNELKLDFENLRNREKLNNYQSRLTQNYMNILDLPKSDFDIRSIIIIASKSPTLTKIVFNYHGKRKQLYLPATYTDGQTVTSHIDTYLREFLNPLGYHVKSASRLPKKLLAVRSGLGVYGRNNLCFVEGMGSYVHLMTYFTDIPCENEEWLEIKNMDLCETCLYCVNNCPTQALSKDRFLIDNERCLTYFNQGGGTDFPLWIDPKSHNSLYGCFKCQIVCPKNREYLKNIIEPIEFTEEETAHLLNGTPLDQLSDNLKQKLNEVNMTGYLQALPRNLKILLNK